MNQTPTLQARALKRLAIPAWLLLPLVLLGIGCGAEATPTPTATLVPTPTPQPEIAMNIDPTKSYIAMLKTEVGDIVIELNAQKAPITVNNFVTLARKGYYDGSTFHRVLPGFMAQGGDPTGTGSGGPGYTIPDEPSDLGHDRGVISMANTGRLNSGGSQFFITYADVHNLDTLNPDGSHKNCGTPGVSCHTVFGKVISGMDVAEALKPRDPSQNPDFPGTTLNEVVIEER